MISPGGLGGAAQAAMQQFEQDKARQAAAKAQQTKIAAQQQAQQQALAQAAAQRKQKAQQVASYAPELPADFWGLSDASANWTNPYYDASIDPTQYERFDYTEPGSGIRTSGNLAASFDQAFLAGLGEVNPIDLSALGSLGSAFNPANQGGLGGAAASNLTSQYQITPEVQRALDLNAAYDKAYGTYNDFLNDDYYQDAFSQLGIDPASIQSREDLDAIDPLAKASIWDVVQRTKQAQNQIPKSGILDSLPGKLALGLTGLISPIGAAGLGAFAGGLSGDGGIGGALSGALQGYSYGNILNNGIQNPFTGTDIVPPAVYNGSGGIPPLGNGPAWVLDHNGTPAPVGGGIPDFGGGFNIPTIPDFGGNQNDTPQIPPINTSGQGGTQPPIDDSQPDNPVIPPVTQPPVNQPPVTSPDLPDIPADPTQYNLSQTGLLNMGGNYMAKPIPGPAQPLNYFGYNDTPFARFI